MAKKQTLKSLLETHDDIDQMTAFWWCEGIYSGGYAAYCSIVLAEYGRRGRRYFTEEFHGETPEQLAEQLAASNVEPPPAETIKQLCESAGRNPKLPRRRRTTEAPTHAE